MSLIIIATTEGNVDVPGAPDVKLGFNACHYKFVSGFPVTLPLFNVTTSQNNPNAAANSLIELKTPTPPINEPIVLEVVSETEIDVEDTKLTPSESAPNS